ncbi:MAG: peptide/nickel transport system ATP-binding protein ddpF [Thermoleophilaceae bacterium]|jgi:peptide/nickel transport system ATP-binding protein|nr:peptide/nickel transport system ATP-binding protein ddpF [Thermoleophilaceae bacterium]
MPRESPDLLELEGGRPSVEGVGWLRDLEVVYPSRTADLRAVRGVTLGVGRGEILALVGESGSGKSSVALALLGLLGEGRTVAKLDGDASVLGVDMLGEPNDERRRLRRRRLGAVFQDPTTSLNPTMTIGRQLIEVAGTPERAGELLEWVGVPEAKLRLKSYPHELSGGQRQRVMIAMAIAGDPALVVADEPTTALDVTVQAQILQLIRRLRDELGCAFLVVTHDLGVAAQIADRVAVCYAGRILETGPAVDVLTRPTHPYTAALLRSRITLRSERLRALTTLPGEPPDPRTPPPGCPFAPRCEHRVDRCTSVLPDLAEVPARPQLSACIRASELIDVLATPKRRDDPLGVAPEELAADVPPALRIRDLHKEFKVRGMGRRTVLKALHGIDLEVSPRECVALVGESGCGKSTLLRVAAGLIDADGGSVEIAGNERPQMVFQDAGASLTPWLDVGEQIMERLRSADVPRRELDARMREALERVGLAPDVADAKPHHLSGGQQQRVAIARAIVVPPPVLLCDEPTSSLDVSLAATVLNLIGKLRRELGMAVVFVTHDLAAARFIADRIAVMYLGRIVESGPAEEVASNPAHPYTRALIAAVPDLDREPARARGEVPSPLNPPSGCPYHPRCASAVAACPTYDPELRQVGAAADRQAACIHVEETAR